jgi:hypothetical protein
MNQENIKITNILPDIENADFELSMLFKILLARTVLTNDNGLNNTMIIMTVKIEKTNRLFL